MEKESPLAINGSRVSGQDARTQNVTAANAIANVVRSSLGPVGLDKMVRRWRVFARAARPPASFARRGA